MKKQRIIVLAIVACLPIALLVWLGVRLARDEQSMVQHQVRQLLTDQLRDTDQSISRFFDALQRDMLRLTEGASVDATQLRHLVRTEPRVSQVFAIDEEGQLLHPPLDATASEAEREFVARAETFLSDKDLVRLTSTAGDGASSTNELAAPLGPAGSETFDTFSSANSLSSHGWHVWYWGRGLNLIFWRRLAGGDLIGIELNRSRWISELIAHLPKSTTPASNEADWQIRLVDSSNNGVYRWGGFEPQEAAEAFAEIPLTGPLSSWRLRYFVAGERFAALAGRSVYFNSFAGISVASLGLIGLVVYLYRESVRELREATTRVNFVNQVSHELKTPLTNIRLYAELLEQDLLELPESAAGKTRQRVGVIVAESNRLSRLIGNVLTFASQQRQSRSPQQRPGDWDAVVSTVLSRFEPSLSQKGIVVEFDPQSAALVEFDADFVEQVLVNLLSNVEKYAAGGRWIKVSTRQLNGSSSIRVADHGPGIPPDQRERIFQPFYRLSDRLEGAVGAGIGLAIARSLARLHGGDVTLIPSNSGAVFEARFQTSSPPSQPAVGPRE